VQAIGARSHKSGVWRRVTVGKNLQMSRWKRPLRVWCVIRVLDLLGWRKRLENDGYVCTRDYCRAYGTTRACALDRRSASNKSRSRLRVDRVGGVYDVVGYAAHGTPRNVDDGKRGAQLVVVILLIPYRYNRYIPDFWITTSSVFIILNSRGSRRLIAVASQISYRVTGRSSIMFYTHTHTHTHTADSRDW